MHGANYSTRKFAGNSQKGASKRTATAYFAPTRFERVRQQPRPTPLMEAPPPARSRPALLPTPTSAMAADSDTNSVLSALLSRLERLEGVLSTSQSPSTATLGRIGRGAPAAGPETLVTHVSRSNNPHFSDLWKTLYKGVQLRHHIKNWQETPTSITKNLTDLANNINPPNPCEKTKETIKEIMTEAGQLIKRTILNHLEDSLNNNRIHLMSIDHTDITKARAIAEKHLQRRLGKKLSAQQLKTWMDFEVEYTDLGGHDSQPVPPPPESAPSTPTVTLPPTELTPPTPAATAPTSSKERIPPAPAEDEEWQKVTRRPDKRQRLENRSPADVYNGPRHLPLPEVDVAAIAAAPMEEEQTAIQTESLVRQTNQPDLATPSTQNIPQDPTSSSQVNIDWFLDPLERRPGPRRAPTHAGRSQKIQPKN